MEKILIMFIAAIHLFLIVCLVHADEGMWLPHQMSMLGLDARGLELNPDALFRADGTGLMNAVVNLGGGTGAFVSREGLILTNHHVAFSALQRASDVQHDYIANGFKAMNRSEEIPAQGYIADILLSYDDVTPHFRSRLKANMSYREKHDAIERVEKKLIAQAEKQGPDIRCTIASMYNGLVYYRFIFKRLKDIRIVYAPPQDIGNFGGETDNWMWPRHTADFTFLRAYVSPDGVGADHAKVNVPYRPESVLTVSTKGIEEGDFTFVMGYPGKTYRNNTVSEMEFDIALFQQRVSQYQDIIDFHEKAGQQDRNIEIRYAGRIKGLSNAVKNYTAKLEWMEKADVLKKRKVLENDLLEWARHDPALHASCAASLSGLAGFMKRYAELHRKKDRLSDFVDPRRGAILLSQAHLLYRLAEEKEKKDADRDPEFQQRRWDEIAQKIRNAERGYHFETDQAYLRHLIATCLEHPGSHVPDCFQKLTMQTLDAFVDDLYSGTTLKRVDRRLELMKEERGALMKMNDSLIGLAAAIEEEFRVLREQERALSTERDELKQGYLSAWLQKTNGKLAPDANGTIRFTSGSVQGYSPRDAVSYQAITTLKGVIEKDKGQPPFRVPDRLTQLHASRDFGPYVDRRLDDVPACFLNTTNVTGGNSGSPTLNARGEQVGIIFDMTYESVIGDYYIIPEFQRTINVDIRYVLFITDKFSDMGYLLREMEIS